MADEVVVQLWVSESSKPSGGQWGRYCSTCPPGSRNDKVSIAGIHIPSALFAPGQQDLSSRPAPITTPLPPAIPLEKDCKVVVSWPYSGLECAENKREYEGGYLPLSTGENLYVLSRAEAGHTTNSFPFYVYCENEKGSRGWAPQLLLHRSGFGSFAVVSGLARNVELNDTFVHVLGLRDDGRVVAKTKDNRQIAVPLANVRLLDFKEDVERIQEKRNRALFYAHPDRFGSKESFALLRMIVNFV